MNRSFVNLIKYYYFYYYVYGISFGISWRSDEVNGAKVITSKERSSILRNITIPGFPSIMKGI